MWYFVSNWGTFMLCAARKGHLCGKSSGFRTEGFRSLMFAEFWKPLKYNVFYPVILTLHSSLSVGITPADCADRSQGTLTTLKNLDPFLYSIRDLKVRQKNLECWTESWVLSVAFWVLEKKCLNLYLIFKFSSTQFPQKGRRVVVFLETSHSCTYWHTPTTDLWATELGGQGGGESSLFLKHLRPSNPWLYSASHGYFWWHCQHLMHVF